MYTAKQKEIISHTRKKVRELFADYPVPAHGIEHVAQVARWAKLIAAKEKADIFLSEMAGWLHDIGRTLEGHTDLISEHQELSYELCQKWFREDEIFCNRLTKQQKLVILYSVRYHWNNAANKYSEAWILRDADKIDTLGLTGAKRAVEFAGGDSKKLQMDIRLRYDMYYWFRTKTAKKIVKEKRLIEQVDRFYLGLLRKLIKPVEL